MKNENAENVRSQQLDQSKLSVSDFQTVGTAT